MTQTAVMDKEAAKEAQKAKLAADLKEEQELNAGRTGKGTRVTIGYTRGKGSQRIKYEAFDTEQPDTLPASVNEFVELVKPENEKSLVAWLIDGYNSSQYSEASDPVAEHFEPDWTPEVKMRFRNVIKNYAAGLGISIEDAVGVIKPPFVKGLSK